MEHRQAIELLTRVPSADLATGEQVELLRHVSECADCAAWTETYGLLADAVSEHSQGGHPASGLLARLAVDPRSLAAAERELVEEHLAVCGDCREELSLARGALGEARGAAAASPSPTRPAAGAASRRLALAASLLLALGLGFFLAPSATPPAPGVVALAEDSLLGTQVIVAPGSISASALSIERGGDVTFRAGNAVVLGEGFSVGAEAQFTVEVAEPAYNPGSTP